MSTVGKNYFIDHRVNALANVFLMGRNSITTCELPNFGELDLLARYVPDEDEYEKLFAVILKGTPEPLPTPQIAASYLNRWRKSHKSIQFWPFPVLVLVFSMQDDEGYFAWQIEPKVTLGQAQLKRNTSFTPERATKKGLDAITKNIEQWYSVEYRKLVVGQDS